MADNDNTVDDVENGSIVEEEDELVYETERTKQHHFYHTADSYPISQAVLETLAGRGVDTIEITVTDDDEVLRFDLEDYLTADTLSTDGAGTERTAPVSKATAQ